MKGLLDTQTWPLMQASSSQSKEHTPGKLPLPATPAEYVPDRIRTSRVRLLEVTHSHALHVAHLPGQHHDPFDRLLIAQAQLDGLTVLTADKVFEKYDIPMLWAG